MNSLSSLISNICDAANQDSQDGMARFQIYETRQTIFENILANGFIYDENDQMQEAHTKKDPNLIDSSQNKKITQNQTSTRPKIYQRAGKYLQSQIEKILKKVKDPEKKGYHICQNFPKALASRINKYLKQNKDIKIEQIELNQDRFNFGDLKRLISSGKLSEDDWHKILCLDEIYVQIDKSKRQGKSKHILDFSSNKKKFLIYIHKEALKIVYKSAKRVILSYDKMRKNPEKAKLTSNQSQGPSDRTEKDLDSYLDLHSRIQLRSLDKETKRNTKYKTQFKYFWQMVERDQNS